MTIFYKNLQIPPDINRLNQIADITITPKLIPNNIDRVHGYVQVYTSNHNEPVLEIPFDEQILHGSVDYSKEESLFYIPSSSNEMNNENFEQCRPIKFLNLYNTPISVYNITLEKQIFFSQHIKVKIKKNTFI
jgi:hypothetical protein